MQAADQHKHTAHQHMQLKCKRQRNPAVQHLLNDALSCSQHGIPCTHPYALQEGTPSCGQHMPAYFGPSDRADCIMQSWFVCLLAGGFGALCTPIQHTDAVCVNQGCCCVSGRSAARCCSPRQWWGWGSPWESAQAWESAHKQQQIHQHITICM